VIEALRVLEGATEPNSFIQKSVSIAGIALEMSGKAQRGQGAAMAQEILAKGKALEKFRRMVELQGGDPGVIDNPRKLPRARQTISVRSTKAGYLASMQCEQIGTACVILGGGRERKEDSVDPAVGIVLHKKVGDSVQAGEPIATIHYNAEARAQRACQLIEQSVEIAEAPPEARRPLIHRVIGKPGEKN